MVDLSLVCARDKSTYSEVSPKRVDYSGCCVVDYYLSRQALHSPKGYAQEQTSRGTLKDEQKG